MSKRRQVVNSSSEEASDNETETKRSKTETETNSKIVPASKDVSSDSTSEGSDEEWTADDGGKNISTSLLKKLNEKPQKSEHRVSDDVINQSANEHPHNTTEGAQKIPLNSEQILTNNNNNNNNNNVNNTNNDNDNANNSSDDDDDSSSSSNNSNNSNSSSSSSSISSSSHEVFDDGLDSDYYGDAEDKLRLSEMTERDCEKEIYARFCNRQRLKERWEISKRLKKEKREKRRLEKEDKNNSKKISKKAKSKNIPDDDLQEDWNRRSNRKRNQGVSERSQAMDQLKHSRLMQKERQEQEKNEDPTEDGNFSKENKKHSSLKMKPPYTVEGVYGPDSETDSDILDDHAPKKHKSRKIQDKEDELDNLDIDSDDFIGPNGKNMTHAERNSPINCLDYLNKIRISRFRIDSWIYMPFFDETIIGCYVRINIGMSNGRPIYRIAEIIELVQTLRVYTINKNCTNKAFKLRIGNLDKTFKLQYISNSDFTNSEFERWTGEMDKAERPIITCFELMQIFNKIEAAKNFVLKDSDIDIILAEKRKFRLTTTNYAMEKTRLLTKKDQARMKGDFKEVERLTSQLQEIEEKSEILGKQRNKQLNGITVINQRNRKQNLKLMEEAHRQEHLQEKQNDPFTRRRCTPTLASITGSKSDHSTPINNNNNNNNNVNSDNKSSLNLSFQTPINNSLIKSDIKNSSILNNSSFNNKIIKKLDFNNNNNNNNNNNKVRKLNINAYNESEDLFSAHDFDIQIDIPIDQYDANNNNNNNNNSNHNKNNDDDDNNNNNTTNNNNNNNNNNI